MSIYKKMSCGKQNIKIDPSLIGSGKTQRAILRAIEIARSDNNIVVIQQTKALIDETYSRVLAELCGDRSIYVRRFHEDVCSGAVAQALKTALCAPDRKRSRQIFLTTWASFELLGEWVRPEDWHCVIDEVPNVVGELDPLRLPNTKKILVPYIRLKKGQSGLYRELKLVDNVDAKQIRRNINDDDVWRLFEPLLRRLSDPNFQIYVNEDKWDAFVDSSPEATPPLRAIWFLKPRIVAGFQSVTILGAIADDSLCFHGWSARSVTFEQLTPANNGLENKEVTLEYLFEDRWSKYRRDWLKANGCDIVKMLLVSIDRGVFLDQDYLWSANNDYNIKHPLRGHRLPGVPHGVNSFRHIHNAAYLSANNPSPDLREFLSEVLGISRGTSQRAVAYQAVYQALGRTSVRSAEFKTTNKFIVPSRPTAEWLAARAFPGARVSKFDFERAGITLPSLPTPGPTRTERPADHRYVQKVRSTFEAEAKKDERKDRLLRVIRRGLPEFDAASGIRLKSHRIRLASYIDPDQSQLHQMLATNRGVVRITDDLGVHVGDCSEEQFVDLLDALSTLPLKRADNAVSIYPYVEISPDTVGPKEVAVSGLWLTLCERDIPIDLVRRDLKADIGVAYSAPRTNRAARDAKPFIVWLGQEHLLSVSTAQSIFERQAERLNDCWPSSAVAAFRDAIGVSVQKFRKLEGFVLPSALPDGSRVFAVLSSDEANEVHPLRERPANRT